MADKLMFEEAMQETVQEVGTQDQVFKAGKAECGKKHSGDKQAYNTCMQTLNRRVSPKGAKKDLKKDKKKDKEARTNWYESQLKK